MPTNLPARNPFRPLAVHATRRDRITVSVLLLGSALLTFGFASLSQKTVLSHGFASVRGV